jgi:hypothetical protein
MSIRLGGHASIDLDQTGMTVLATTSIAQDALRGLSAE